MRIAITGASGNVGSALLRRLERTGEHDVVGIARRIPQGGAPFDSAQWRSIDLTLPTAAGELAEAFAGIDAVVHLAWGFQPSHRLDLLEELGVGGTRRVVEAVTAAGVPHLVHMSSVGAYSPKVDDTPVDESYPTDGVPGSPYSQHKSSAERLLDDHLVRHPDLVLTRIRPGIVGQRNAGSALLRYGLPAVVPSSVLGHVPVLPLDRSLLIPMVHADDVAEGIARAVEGSVPGPFNLAAEPAVDTAAVARVLGARAVHVPAPVIRAAVAASWKARLQPLDPGWIDLGFAVPLMDTARARSELGWEPTVGAVQVLAETVAGMREAASDTSPALRPRSVLGQLARGLRLGPVTNRREP